MHKYVYGHGDPISGVDPLGLSLVSTVSGIAGSLAVDGLSTAGVQLGRTAAFTLAGAVNGLALGYLIGFGDGLVQGAGLRSFKIGLWTGAWGAVLGGLSGFLAAQSVAGAAVAWWIGVGANLMFTSVGVYDALVKGDIGLALYRVTIGIFLGRALYESYIPSSTSGVKASSLDLHGTSAVTNGARAVAKHSVRPGSAWQPLTGNQAAKNSQAQSQIDAILNDPHTVAIPRPNHASGPKVDFVARNGQGVRAKQTESGLKFEGLLEPPPAPYLKNNSLFQTYVDESAFSDGNTNGGLDDVLE